MEDILKEKLPLEVAEYKHFVVNYLLPLLGLKNITLQYINTPLANSGAEYIYRDGENVVFTNGKSILFKLGAGFEFSEDSVKISNLIVGWFTKVSKYNIVTGKRKISYESDIIQSNNYELAIQNGICEWIGGAKNKNVERLFNILEHWVVKTYEGHNVTLGVIINPCKKSTFDTTFGDWCEFLNDDFSALLTDCVNSVVELDKNCNFCRYISITENNRLKETRLVHDVPYKFTSIINEYVIGECVGIFLLANGDIILSKNGKVLFVRRNFKWLNFSYEAFEKVIYHNFGKNYVDDSLLKEIFASTLDVSFSHLGGIISVVDKDADLTDEDGSHIINKADCLLEQISLKELKAELQAFGLSEEEANHRVLKRNVILELTKGKDFAKLDRKLRCELISLDGACVINTSGKARSFGAIIKNDNDSSGGGRGAAAKKLSGYGFAIKISTDGYVELYINGEIKYAIK